MFILGAGMTGLASGLASGLPVYEAAEVPGGICSSYYMRPNKQERLPKAAEDGEMYRFEIGGGHWIFGGDPVILRFIREIAPTRRYFRKSSVYLPDKNLFIPYPLQNHLKHLGADLAAESLSEMVRAVGDHGAVVTMNDWLLASFGPTLCNLFFDSFHNLYTAGLSGKIAPQDSYKSPVDLSLAIKGSLEQTPAVGYNASFIYPVEGLDVLAARMASQADIHYGKRAKQIDIKEKIVYFDDNTSLHYETLLSTLPLNRMMQMTGLTVDEKPSPSTSVLVVNLGAEKGPRCPEDHWVYVPSSKTGFHRVGFYSNVDASFLPKSSRDSMDRVSIYVEKAYPEGETPGKEDLQKLSREMARELQSWDWIKACEVIDPTWIDTAYTWSWPGSKWKEKALKALESQDIYQVGRYARWIFQGIADSIRDGFMAGAALKRARHSCESLIS